MITHRCACEKSYIPIIMTSITWAGPRCVQEPLKTAFRDPVDRNADVIILELSMIP